MAGALISASGQLLSFDCHNPQAATTTVTAPNRFGNLLQPPVCPPLGTALRPLAF